MTLRSKSILNLNVMEIAKKKVIKVQWDTPIEEIAAILGEKKIKKVPVERKGVEVRTIPSILLHLLLNGNGKQVDAIWTKGQMYTAVLDQILITICCFQLINGSIRGIGTVIITQFTLILDKMITFRAVIYQRLHSIANTTNKGHNIQHLESE